MNENSVKGGRNHSLRISGAIGKWGLRLATLALLLISGYLVLYFVNFVGRRGTISQYFFLIFPLIYSGLSFSATFIRRRKSLIITAVFLNVALAIEEIAGYLEETTTGGIGWQGLFILLLLWILLCLGRYADQTRSDGIPDVNDSRRKVGEQ